MALEFPNGKSSWQLLTDFYELTMAYGYWKSGRMEMPAVFTLFFRSNPYGGGYALVSGLEAVISYLEAYRFTDDDLRYLSTLQTSKGAPWFEPAFLEYLGKSRLSCDIEAIPEGTVVFPYEPLLKVTGPLWQSQLLESALLNMVNFQTLVATKASRVCWAAQGKPVVDFGLRRAQGPDGAISASRAAFIGGVIGTSNVLAGKLYEIPVKGTHAHSWIMSFPSELEAFDSYATSMPDDCVLLVDTYNTAEGVEHAIEIGKRLRLRGKELSGIRIDSGDLAYLSQDARRRLDEAGFSNVKIVASNELDEHLIQSLNFQNAKIDLWGVGTNLVTGRGQGAMNGIYKLAAVSENGTWTYKIKVSDQPAKTTNPGIHRVCRFFDSQGLMEGDLIYDESEEASGVNTIIDPLNSQRRKPIHSSWSHEELLVPVFEKGRCVYELPSLAAIRSRAQNQLSRLHPGHKRFENPHEYPVGLSPFLSKLKQTLIERHREGNKRC